MGVLIIRIILCILIFTLLLWISYLPYLKVSHDADEQSELIFQKWKEEQDAAKKV